MEKKGGPCVLLIKLFPQLYTIIALKQQKLLGAQDKPAHFEKANRCSIMLKNSYALLIYKATD